MSIETKLPSHIRMAISEWTKIEDNPIQRNTERHASKALKNHLSHPSVTHLEVSAAQLPDGRLIKLDGHTRTLLWSSGELEVIGDFVNVTIYPVASVSEAKDLYLQFDNQKAAESAGDRGYGALRDAGIAARTGFICEGKINVAMQYAELARTGVNSKPDINKAVIEWKRELEIFDQLRLGNNKISSWIMCAGLMTIRKHGDGALDFWEKYKDDRGLKTDRGRDGVEMLCRYVEQVKKAKQVGSNWAGTHTPKALAAFDGYRRGYLFSMALKPKDLLKYL